MKKTFIFFGFLLLYVAEMMAQTTLQSISQLNYGYVQGVKWQGHWAGIRYMTHEIDIFDMSDIQVPVLISANTPLQTPNCLEIYQQRYLLIGGNQSIAVWDLMSNTPSTPIANLALTGSVLSITMIQDIAFLTTQEPDGKYKLQKINLVNPSIPSVLSSISFTKPISPLFSVGNQAFLLERYQTSGKLYTYSVDTQGNLSIIGIVITPQAQFIDIRDNIVFVSGNNILTQYDVVINDIPVLKNSQSLNTPLGISAMEDGNLACMYNNEIKLVQPTQQSTIYNTASSPVFLQEIEGYLLFSTTTGSHFLETNVTNAVAQPQFSALVAYPNPSTMAWHFDVENLFEKETIFTLYNIEGREVVQMRWDNAHSQQTIPVPQAGVYFYTVTQAGSITHQGKLIGQ